MDKAAMTSFDFNDDEKHFEAEAAKDVDDIKNFYFTYGTSKEEVEKWCEKEKAKGNLAGTYQVTSNGIIVDGSYYVSNEPIKKIKYKFLKTTDEFCVYKCDLETLENCPKEVGSIFDCSDNKLTSLVFGPEKVGNTYICSSNNLKSLVGLPDVINGFNCSFCQLKTLEGSPKKINGSFYCSYNNLATLKGAPNDVGGDFDCSHNILYSLKDAPHHVKFVINCSYNRLCTLKELKDKFFLDVQCEWNAVPPEKLKQTLK